VIALAIIAAASAQPPRPVMVRATASVRIERPVSIDANQWKQVPEGSRRETIIRDEQGRELLLRLVEQQ
jgi:hypothetical protein